MANSYEDRMTGWDFPVALNMPSAREIELDLALGSESWQSLLAPNQASPAARTSTTAGLLTAWSSSWAALERSIRAFARGPHGLNRRREECEL
jgi:hypothetical protein